MFLLNSFFRYYSISYAGYKIIASAQMITSNIIQGKQPENIWYKALNASNIILFFITIIGDTKKYFISNKA